MTTGDLPAPPEGKLIRSARERAIPKVTIRAAAARIDISPEHWGNIERGYKSVSANEAPVRVEASAELMAKMAAVVHVTPEQMETRGQRPDAAEVMRETARRETAPPRLAEPPLPEFTPEMAADMAAWVDEVRLRVALARHHQPDGPLDGRRVFPLDKRGQFFWDAVSAVGHHTEESVIVLTAAHITRAIQEEAAEARRKGNSAAG